MEGDTQSNVGTESPEPTLDKRPDIRCFAHLAITDGTILKKLLYEANLDGGTFFTYRVTGTAVDGLLRTTLPDLDFERVDVWFHVWDIEFRLAAFVEWAKLRKVVLGLLRERLSVTTDGLEMARVQALTGRLWEEISAIYKEIAARMVYLTAEQLVYFKEIWFRLDIWWMERTGVETDRVRLGNVLMMDLGNTSVVVTDAPFLQCVPVDELVRIGFRSSLVLNGLEERHLNRGIGLSLGVLGVVCFQEGHLSSRQNLLIDYRPEFKMLMSHAVNAKMQRDWRLIL
ncbi:hypothetical protein C2857_000483 [Epichloe festucae Fl1]|uniref:Uncharacterized protein n=1 Tax=Epichloe festucae (strain Fl1) TaxID=877507 RepID=A0A7S9PWW2_EPIFF|nr:hypothetical protein C2857_000483 [Epichloe festucae Fl1]